GLATPAVVLALAFLLSAPAATADDPLPPVRTVPGGGSTARVAPGPAPRSAVAVSPDYRLSAGDEIEVEVAVPAAAEADNPVREPKKTLGGPGGPPQLPKVQAARSAGGTVPARH